MTKEQLRLIPTPKKLTDYGDTVRLSTPAVCTDYEPWQDCTDVFIGAIQKIHNIHIDGKNGEIELIYDKNVPQSGYIIDCNDTVKAFASDAEGAQYALVSLLQMIDCNENEFSIPKVRIEDCPDKDFRTLMVDLSREWHPLFTIFRYIDVCYYFKVKYLHLHFIDDQLYTLPSKSFPDIATKGRSYSFEDIEKICAYAKTHGIVIIPEIEAPGHANSFIRSYPEVFANTIENGSDAHLITEEGNKITADNLICAGSDKAMRGLKILIHETARMFPDSPYIHIGGDEANIAAWNHCSTCVKYMKDNGISDEHELYSDFIARVAQLVIDEGRTPIVWEGFPKKSAERVPRETIVIAWESHYHMVDDLLEEGFKVINATWQPLYIVPGGKLRWSSRDILNWNVYNWQHWWEKSKAYLNPFNVQPTEQVIGAQLCSWQCTYEMEINFIMENAAALSERTWNVERYCTEQEYIAKQKRLMLTAGRLIQSI